MFRVRGAIILGLACSQAIAGYAAEGTTPPAGSPPPAASPYTLGGVVTNGSQIRPVGAPIVLEVGKGTLIRLTKAAATVFIANPDVADVEVKAPTLIYLSAKEPGETVIYAVDADENVLLQSPVRVEHDLSRLRQSLGVLMPGENISVNSVDNSLVLSGNVSTAGRAEKAREIAAAIAADVKNANVVNQLGVNTPNQINLRVKIAEVNRQALKALGFNWQGSWVNNRLDHSTFNFATNNPTTGGPITNQNLFTYGFALPGMGSLQVTLDALASEGLITTLAEPNLTARSGQNASFLAGGEFPVPVAASGVNGTQTVTVEFKQFGVSLDFTPTIVDADHISLRIRPEVSQLSSTGAVQISGFSIPALTVRRAETTVELGSGESFALAGLLENTTEQDISKVPWLGDIPVIGQLFRSNQFQHNETELVIIVTPYLVKPSHRPIAAPTDGFVLPHDAQSYGYAATYREALPARSRGPQGPNGLGLVGPAGFRVD